MGNRGSTFADRSAAGRALASEVAKRDYSDPVVLALPRGGVPVAFEVAKALAAPLDLIMVRKLGAPGHSEYAIGAVVDGENPQIVLDDKIAKLTGASESFIQRSLENALAEIERRRTAYGIAQPAEIRGRTAIVIDDGIATGSTAQAALKAIRQSDPASIVLAVPVAPPDSLANLAPLCDEVICLSKQEPFYAVGAHYLDFGQTSDQEVVACLAKARDFSTEGQA